MIPSGTRNSLHLRKPKNPTQHAAHSMRFAKTWGSWASIDLMQFIMDWVIGSRVRVGCVDDRAIPRKRSLTYGVWKEGSMWEGSVRRRA